MLEVAIKVVVAVVGSGVVAALCWVGLGKGIPPLLVLLVFAASKAKPNVCFFCA